MADHWSNLAVERASVKALVEVNLLIKEGEIWPQETRKIKNQIGQIQDGRRLVNVIK